MFKLSSLSWGIWDNIVSVQPLKVRSPPHQINTGLNAYFDWLPCFFKASNPSTLFVSIKLLRLIHNTPVPCPMNEERGYARGCDFHNFIESLDRLSSR